MCESVSQFVAHVHRSVNDISQIYLLNERRFNYTTPKSFLEQIKLYQNLLRRKHHELQVRRLTSLLFMSLIIVIIHYLINIINTLSRNDKIYFQSGMPHTMMPHSES